MSRAFDLEKKSREFKEELDELLNKTVCTGISLRSIVVTPQSPLRMVVGFNITKDNQDVTEGIPVTTSSRDARFYLGLSIRLAPDEEHANLTVTNSVMILATAPNVADEANILLHYDYERDKENYPEAHLQVCASSDAWAKAGQRLDGKERLLERLHLPVGGRRFRPTLEDLIEFLIVEKLAERHDGWDSAIEASRSRFREKQLRAAVRNDPHPAVEELRKQGYKIEAPKTPKKPKK